MIRLFTAIAAMLFLTACGVNSPLHSPTVSNSSPSEGGVAFRIQGLVQPEKSDPRDDRKSEKEDGKKEKKGKKIAWFRFELRQAGKTLLAEQVHAKEHYLFTGVPAGPTHVFVAAFDSKGRNISKNGGAWSTILVRDQAITPLHLELVVNRGGR